MKIIVLVKEVPDTYGTRSLHPETGLAERKPDDAVMDEISARALEAALTHAAGNPGTEVTVMSMAPATATANLRKALAMGADNAVHVCDEALAGADLRLTAATLAAAVERTGFDLVITGNVSTDGSGGVLAGMLGEHLSVAAVTSLSVLTITPESIQGTRSVDGGTLQVEASLPAVVSVTEALPDPRLPGLKGIMAAKKKPLTVLTAAELGITADDHDLAHSIMLSLSEKPPRAAGVKIEDDGGAAQQLVDYLQQNKLVEGVS